MVMKKFKLSKKAAIIICIAACFIIPIVAYGSYLAYILYFRETPTIVDNNKSTTSQLDEEDIYSDLPAPEESGIDNIVLFGVDDRSDNYQGRTDSIIIATIDKNAKVIKLTSIMRDTYVKIGDTNSMNRVNAAYAIGGPELALKTLNNNFDLDLKYYAIIDFRAFQELVDKVGGVYVNVKDYEVDELNRVIREINGDNSTYIEGPGFQHLNGQQALAFSRIRKVGNGDWERTERQRLVLKSLVEKSKEVNILKIPQLLTTLATYVQTNVPLSKIISLGITAYGFEGGIETMRIPVDAYYEPQSVNGNSVLVPDISANALFLREFIYNIKIVGNKDVPVYMQNNFHMDDSLAASKPKPNIPDYSTPKPSATPSPTPVITKPETSPTGSKPTEEKPSPTESQPQPTEVKPTPTETKPPTEGSPEPTESASQSTEGKTESTGSQSKPSEGTESNEGISK